MNPLIISGVLFMYFTVLVFIAWLTSRKANADTFFTGNKQSPWYLVAFGMIGTSLSGVTFISVPGTVGANGWFYFQLVLGFFIGYFVVAFVLLPLYYKYNLSSIYRYLEYRLGFTAYQWGAGYFILSRTLGATVRLYLVINVLQLFVFNDIGIPFGATTFLIMTMIVIYTLKGGVKTIVWTDTLQTLFMLLALIVCIFSLQEMLGLDWNALWSEMKNQQMTRLWSLQPERKDFFLKALLGGAFITITMTGLDQEMMQKNISVKTLKDAQKNMITFSIVLLLVNALFLLLGGLLHLYATRHGLTYAPDDLFPSIVRDYLPKGTFLIFIIGLISALFPSVDGAITALTSSFCIDILGFQRRTDLNEKQQLQWRQWVHLGFAALFTLFVFFFKLKNDKSIIDLVFVIAGYTYGPLLGLFAFGILTKRSVANWTIPVVCLAAPVGCYIIDKQAHLLFGSYKFGNELLLINGTLTFVMLYAFSSNKISYNNLNINENKSIR
jgi:Na+/proline symporter